MAFSALQLTSEHALLPAAPFTLVVVSLCLLLVWLLRHGGLLPALLVSLVIALATLIRPVSQLLLPFALLAVLLGPGTRRRRLLHAVVAAVAFAIVMTPWMLFNLSIHGSFTIGGTPGESLLNHTLSSSRGRFTFDGPGTPATSDPVEQTTRGILQAAVRSGTPPGQVRERVRARLKLTEAETDGLLQHIVIATIRRHPLDVLLSIPDSLVKLYALDEPIAALWSSLTAWETMPKLGSLARRPTFDQELSKGRVDTLLNVLRPNRFALMLPLLGLLAPVLARRSVQRWSVLLLTALYASLILAQVALDGQVAHYRSGTGPLVVVLATLTLWHCPGWIGRRLASAAPRPAQPGLVGRLRCWAPLGLAFVVGVFLRCWGLARFDPAVFGNEFDEGIRLAQLDLMNAGFRPFSQIYSSQGPLREPFVDYRQGATGLGALGGAWSLDTNWQRIRQVLADDAALATLALADLPALLRCSPRYAIVAGGWLVTTFLMLLGYSPLAENMWPTLCRHWLCLAAAS